MTRLSVLSPVKKGDARRPDLHSEQTDKHLIAIAAVCSISQNSVQLMVNYALIAGARTILQSSVSQKEKRRNKENL